MENKTTLVLVFVFIGLIIVAAGMTVRNYVLSAVIAQETQDHQRLIDELDKQLDEVEKTKNNSLPTPQP